MKRINTHTLYLLGKKLEPISRIDEDNSTFGDVQWMLFGARGQITEFLSSDTLPIKTCRQAADQLVAAINNVISHNIQAMVQRNKAEAIDWWSLRTIKDAASRFETVLTEELAIVDTYSVTQKGAYSTSDLIHNAETLFPKDVQGKIPPISIQDIREAGKCLAFETPTAAAFHVLRSVESVILAYHQKVLGNPPLTRMRNWGVYINNMRKSGLADAKILDFLVHIKDNYRNPVSHPDAVLTIDEVLVLIGVSVAAISQMAAAL